MAVLMGPMIARETVFDNGTLLLAGLWDVHSLSVEGRTFVYGAGYADNGVTAFELGANGSLTPVGNVADTPSLALAGASGFSSAVVGGKTYLYVNGAKDSGVNAFSVNADGTLTFVQTVLDSASADLAMGRPSSRMAVTSAGGQQYLVVPGYADDGLSVFRIGPDGRLTNTANVTDTGNALYALDGAYGTATAQVGGHSFIFVSGAIESGVSAFELLADGTLAFRSTLRDTVAFNLSGAADLATATVGGTTYLVASSARENGISVFSVDASGTMNAVSHLVDGAGTPLKGATGLSTFVIDGETFVAVSGSRGNTLAVLHMDEAGQLSTAAWITDTGALALGRSLMSCFTVVDGVPLLVGAGPLDWGMSVFELGGADDQLAGTSQADLLMGLGGNDTLTGNDGADRLLGGRGDDVIHAGAGDHVDGGAGTDSVNLVAPLSDYIVTGTAGDLTLTGRKAGMGTVKVLNAENLSFGGQTVSAATLAANEGPTATADIITVRHGSPAMFSAATFLDNDSDADSPASGFAIASVANGTGGTVSLTPLGTIIFMAQPGFVGTGSFTYRLTDGQGGLSAPVTVAVNVNAAATIQGSSGADVISSTSTVAGQPKTTALTDLIFGNGGNDSLDGGGGTDLLYGGAGNDRYVVDSAGDLASERNRSSGLDDGGSDTVTASIDYTLGDFIENLTLVGAATSGIGNALNNRLVANGSNNVLQGGDGNDSLFGGAGDDVLDGGAGNDTLDGGTGADQMSGGAGNDSYVVDNAGDVVDEDGGSGIDSVSSSISLTLGTGVENLTLTGTAVSATGNELANRLSGNGSDNVLSAAAGNDTLLGNGGNDTLVGGAGSDRLTGGAGADHFVFDQAPLAANGSDRITDFALGQDRLVFEADVFTQLGADLAAAFHLGTQAGAADDRLIYDQGLGRLYYDADGVGGAGQVLLLQIDTKPALQATDLLVL